MATIIKNTDSIDHKWGGINVTSASQYSMQEVDRLRLLSDSYFLDSLTNGFAVVNNGEDLNAEQGLLHLQKQLKTVHEALNFAPAVGIAAPELTTISATGAAHGHKFEINDEMFALTHFDGLILNNVKLQLHLVIDNSVADRWIQFDFTVLSTTGILDKAIDGYDQIISTGPVEVPTTPFLIFDMKISVPASIFDEGRDNLFIRVKRTVPVGKTAPTNHPIIVRMDKIHKQRLDL